MPTVIDAHGLVVGRLATQVAKKLLAGEEVMLINAEKAVVVGGREDVYADYFEKFNRGDWHGPWIPRMPDQILRRVIRGMLPYKKARGRTAWRRLSAYIGVPRGVDAAKALRIEDARPSGARPTVALEDVARYLGAQWRDAVTLLPGESVLPPAKEKPKAGAGERKKAPAKEEKKESKESAPKREEKRGAEPAKKETKLEEAPKKEAKPAEKGEPKPKPTAKAEGKSSAKDEKKVK